MKTVPFALALAFMTSVSLADEAKTINVLTYNIWWGGVYGGQPLEKTIEVIKKSNADIVGIQEKDEWDDRGEAFWPNNTQAIARALKFDFIDQNFDVDGMWNDIGMMTTFKFGKALSENQLCAPVNIEGKENGREILFCNIHLYTSPYQPYQLSGIEYRGAPVIKTEEAAIAYANAARGNGIDTVLKDIEAYSDKYKTIIITGDFNEPSHLDWTQKAVDAGIHPVKVAYPQSTKLQKAGFTDAYRAIYQDEVKHPGFTWTPTTKKDDPKDHHDRIDFIYVKGATVKAAQVLGERTENADIIVTPWPSDHRAVVVTLEIN